MQHFQISHFYATTNSAVPPCLRSDSDHRLTEIPTTTTTTADPTTIKKVVKSKSKTRDGRPSNVKAICEQDGYTTVTAANFETFIKLSMGELALCCVFF